MRYTNVNGIVHIFGKRRIMYFQSATPAAKGPTPAAKVVESKPTWDFADGLNLGNQTQQGLNWDLPGISRKRFFQLTHVSYKRFPSVVGLPNLYLVID